MKVVIYHADSHFPWGGNPGEVYSKHCSRFKEQCNGAGMKMIHLTCTGHPGWGDENHSFDLDPKNIVANREEVFTEFLEKAPEDWYWFAEPDFVIHKMFKQPRECDAVFLFRRGDDVPMTPAWRLARPSALPIFQELREEMRKDPRKDWHGDSAAFTNVWNRMGKPCIGQIKYLGCKVHLWDYADFVKPGRWTKNLLGKQKLG